MAITDTSVGRQIERRTFLLASFAAAIGAAEPPRFETFTQWLNASRKARALALQPCVERIRAMDVSIQAWVQVLPQRPTGTGTLSEIPFGVKDIIETKGLATEYGSPIYKGRIGSADAAIVRDLRQVGEAPLPAGRRATLLRERCFRRVKSQYSVERPLVA